MNQATNPILKWLAEGRASSTTQVCVHPLALAHHPPLQWTYNDKIKSSTLGLNDGHHQHWINLRRHPKKPPPPTSNPATWHILIHQRRPYQTKKMPSIKLNMASDSRVTFPRQLLLHTPLYFVIFKANSMNKPIQELNVPSQKINKCCPLIHRKLSMAPP